MRCRRITRLERQASLSPSPGTPGEGRGEGLLQMTRDVGLEEGPHPALSRRTGRGESLIAYFLATLFDRRHGPSVVRPRQRPDCEHRLAGVRRVVEVTREEF